MLFHLFTVQPVPVEAQEMPLVRYGDHYVQADSLAGAMERIKDHQGVADAPEVWGSQLSPEWVLSPNSRRNLEVATEQHRYWAGLQEEGGYRLLQRGPESVRQWGARTFNNTAHAHNAPRRVFLSLVTS